MMPGRRGQWAHRIMGTLEKEVYVACLDADVMRLIEANQWYLLPAREYEALFCGPHGAYACAASSYRGD